VLERAARKKEPRIEKRNDPFWKGLRDTGTELWLDTGDIDAARALWNTSFSGLTTNNTLLNAEIQKGMYDDLVVEAGKVVRNLEPDTKVVEIAFILNAFHGLRLVNRFGAKVSVELHTIAAHDVDTTVRYAKRFHRICPGSFVIKIPLTPAGLVATRLVRQQGIPVNFTLGFGARQNFLAASFARPTYVNVFLGRLNSYVSGNNLGDGKMVGEKATLASQKAVAEVSKNHPEPTRQIAASMREPRQVADLAGVQVLTMPVTVADEVKQQLDGTFRSRRGDNYPVTLREGVDGGNVRLEKLWEISDEERKLAASLEADVPASVQDLTERCYSFEIEDLFPRFMSNDISVISLQGKIPTHETWEPRIARGEIALDSLLNLAALQSFATDQRALDDRIRRLIS
jgi:transaldolase